MLTDSEDLHNYVPKLDAPLPAYIRRGRKRICLASLMLPSTRRKLTDDLPTYLETMVNA